MTQEELENRVKHSKWQVRNSALKVIGAKLEERSIEILKEILLDKRPSTWIKKVLGEPFHQVGFIRRNTWMALKKQAISESDFNVLLPNGLDDPYYEVRTATWDAIYYKLNDKSWHFTNEWEIKLKERVKKEKNFEILLAMLPSMEYIFDIDEILEFSHKIRKYKSWRVRGAYFDLLVSLYEKDLLPYEKLKPYLNNVHLRSDYFKPIFLLKEKRQNLDRLLEAQL